MVRRFSAAALLAVSAGIIGALVMGQPALAAPGGLPGMDVSRYQGDVNWQKSYSDGARFAYIKATEGTDVENPNFAQQYNGSYKVGMIRGAYHFAIPSKSTGAAQANYFLKNGGGWSKDGKTLPGALDIEYNPYSGGSCYGLSQSKMQDWIKSFIDTYHSATSRYPVIYTTTDWWKTCTGNYSGFAKNSPLWIAKYASSVGTLPAGWSVYSFWQWSDSGTFPGDQDVWNGDLAGLRRMACGGTC